MSLLTNRGDIENVEKNATITENSKFHWWITAKLQII